MTTETGPLARMLPALLIVALLACMLVPLSTLLVDVLLSLSLSAAVLLLVASMTVRRSADFLGFPRLLLLTTLFRLALNVQTTRLILADRFAGEVIAAFSSLVVREELIVGVVMFGIITAVQFLVVTRGSERVAEVAARFALDGLPGHQAAIDADLRSGAIASLASEVKGTPSCQVMPERRWKVKVSPSSLISQLSASPGWVSSFWSRVIRVL